MYFILHQSLSRLQTSPFRVNFECRFTSDSRIKSVEWYKDNVQIHPSMLKFEIAVGGQNSKLTIKEAMHADAAIYTVKIFNEVGPVESSAKLLVTGPLVFLITILYKDMDSDVLYTMLMYGTLHVFMDLYLYSIRTYTVHFHFQGQSYHLS